MIFFFVIPEILIWILIMVLFSIGLNIYQIVNPLIGTVIGILVILLMIALGIFIANKIVYEIFDEEWIALFSIILWIITTVYYVFLLTCNFSEDDNLIVALSPIALPTVSLIFALIATIICCIKIDLNDRTRFIIFYSTAAVPLICSLVFSILSGHTINVIEALKLMG